MKEGWEYKKLGEVCEKISDGSHNPPKGVVMSRNIMLSSQNIQNDSLDMTKVRFISDEDFLIENQRTQAKKGDVLLTIVGTIGRTCVLNGTEGNITFQRSVAVLKPSKEITSRFLMYFLLSQNSVLNATAQGAAQKGIYLKQLGNFGISYPPLSEQQRIVDYLDSAFAKIDAMKANAEKSLMEAKALFQASLKEMLEPKEGWEEKTLGEIAVFSQGIQVDVNLQTEIYSPGKVRFLRIIDVTQGNVPPRYIDDPGERYYLKADEIAMVRYGTVGFVCYGFEGVIANNLFKVSIKDKSKLQSNYLQYFLKSDLFQSHIRKGVGGAALPAIKFGDIKHIMLGIPPLSEQQSIVATLDSLKSKVDRLQANFEKISQECDALKQALLREVFEG